MSARRHTGPHCPLNVKWFFVLLNTKPETIRRAPRARAKTRGVFVLSHRAAGGRPATSRLSRGSRPALAAYRTCLPPGKSSAVLREARPAKSDCRPGCETAGTEPPRWGDTELPVRGEGVTGYAPAAADFHARDPIRRGWPGILQTVGRPNPVPVRTANPVPRTSKCEHENPNSTRTKSATVWQMAYWRFYLYLGRFQNGFRTAACQLASDLQSRVSSIKSSINFSFAFRQLLPVVLPEFDYPS